MDIPFEQIMTFILPLIIFYVIYKIVIEKIPAFKLNKRIKPLEDVPRDAMDRIKRDLKKSARMSKPPGLTQIWLSGDKEIPRKYLGKVWGFIPSNDYYTFFYRPRGSWRIKVLFVEREFSTPPQFKHITVEGRGIEINGTLFHFVIPRENWAEYFTFNEEEVKTASDRSNMLWLMRASHIQILCEKQATLDRIEIRDWVEKKSILPKTETQHLRERGYKAVDEAEEREDWASG